MKRGVNCKPSYDPAKMKYCTKCMKNDHHEFECARYYTYSENKCSFCHTEPGLQGGQGVPSGSHFKKLGEFSRDDSLLEYSTHERSPPMQGNPENKNSAKLRHPNHVIEPDQVSQVRGQKTPAMGYNSPAFQAEINEKIHNKNRLDFESEDNAELNSYKFPKPRFYNPNLYKSERPMDTIKLLSDIAQQVGPKERPLTYQDFLEDTLRKLEKG